ncbi:Predicted neuraminidase (sialidase) [Chitinophaga costaii]|uniref:Predicted neuraminidase (Sialidase) n=2 Tax=Chitinophaga costaii TaxID=1335309 RepID=A0A1C4F860_9BACT|nr:Predicted neuraminidase (sialidase) [Chitinophaga costaii]
MLLLRASLVAVVFITSTLSSCKKETRQEDSGKQTVLTLNPGYNNPRNNDGDFVTLKNGGLLFVYTHFTGTSTEDDGPAYLASRFSSDSGKTWTVKDELVATPDDGAPSIMCVSVLRLQNGNIALLYLRKKSMQDCIPMIQISTDEASTWSKPKAVITDKRGYFTINNNRVVQLANGRLILPVSQHYLLNGPPWSFRGVLLAYYSDDDGVTWKCGNAAPNPNGITTQEPGVIPMKNGDVLMFIRTDQNVQYYSRSTDQGQTWSPIQPSPIKSPVAPASISRIPTTGDLLLAWNNNDGTNYTIKDRRTPYNIAISTDEGNSWPSIITLESNPDGWYAYTSIHYMGKYVFLAHSDGRVSRGTQQSVISITRLDINWIYSQIKS